MIPSGETGSVYDLANRTLEDPYGIAYKLRFELRTALNVLSTLEQYGYHEIAIKFAKFIIDFQIIEK